jgi:2-polyprenyl-3-methyl-5-hydroxy-6-metoxy-1,4-benzoquinol methylase
VTPHFTAHNIRLDDGTCTKPETGFVISDHPWLHAARRVVELAFPHSREGLRLVDLGCLEGGHTIEFARMGFDALGIDVRESNIACCRYVQDRVSLPNLAFVCDDALNVEKYGEFDVVYCCGLLYHLDRPRAYLDTLARVCRTLLILNTHFATLEETSAFKLSALTSHEGLRGRWYDEDENSDMARIDDRWASYANARSFWPLRGDLVTALGAAGFASVMEVYDALTDPHAALNQNHRPDQRAIFVCAKPP